MALKYQGICRKCNIECTGAAKGNCWKLQRAAERIANTVIKAMTRGKYEKTM